MATDTPSRPVLLVSSCLLGQPTRYDGKDKRIPLPDLSGYTVVPFCPEVAAGLGIPREPIEIVRTPEGVRVLSVHTRRDVTDRLRAACGSWLETNLPAPPAACLLKARSPSCGIESPLHAPDGAVVGAAPGLWASLLRERFPGVPLCSEETFRP